MYSKRHKNVKIGQRKRSYVSKKYNKNRTRNINGGSRYRRYGKTGGAGIISGMNKAVSKFEDWIRTKIVREDADGNKYEFVEKNSNTFIKDLFNGEGKITMKNGDVYKSKPKEGKFMEDGKFVDSKLNGYGKLTYANDKFNGMVYDGEWKDGKKNGYGILTWGEGTLECTWKDDWPDNGHAKRTYQSGDVYEGKWASDKGRLGGPSCKGKVKYTYKNGDIYEGEFHDCKRHGDGKYTFKNDDWDRKSFEGKWVNGTIGDRHSHFAIIGKMTYTNGDVFEGFFKINRNAYEPILPYDLEKEQGKLTYANGTFIEERYPESSPWR